ncbi:SLBB domain-containing protein [Emticicia sp. TH156]|uniref:SLBB domain-containing protein n=1 Tax=Emticicia sp. TH156 TaxID=2067454 RepID=UPI000C75F8EA|nr:SLBB domain-containing protein [Emticicia sp. TH156]PLK42571.1 sugar transporter [Emticicia sp. TH156]
MASLKTIFKVLVLMLFISEVAYSQVTQQMPENVDKLTDKQLEALIKAAEKRGLSDAQIEAMAIANGYSAQDIAKVKERINRLNNKSTNDKTGVDKTRKSDDSNRKRETGGREQLGDVDVKDLSAESRPEIVNRKDSVAKKPVIFGSQLFNNKNLTFEPNLRLPTPKNYILGPDDELRIDITGYAYQHYSTTVSPEGTIKIENLQPIYVNGNTIEQAKGKIVARLKTIFAGLRNGTLNVDVTLGDVRTIKITVVGEVQNPGTYSLSSLATAFNALYLSGGPTEKGSLRNIQIIRDNAVIKKIDVYNFLLKGTREDDMNLTDQDVILVPVVQNRVRITGQVNKEGIFELKENDNFKTLLEYAGGFTDKAYTATVNVTRNTQSEKKILTFDPQANPEFVTQNGDQFLIGTILDRFENKVGIKGAVMRPGEFALGGQIKTVRQLIEFAKGLREDAYPDRAILVRKKDNFDSEYQAINLRKLLNGEISDIELKREDQLLIKSIGEIREDRLVYIEGAVNIPGFYEFAENMEVKDLILLAGGLSDGATSKRVEIARRLYNDESNDKTTEIINFSLSSVQGNENLTKLKPFDKVFIRNLPNYDDQPTVQIVGEVNYPGSYAIENKSDRIVDIIDRAGGLRKESDITSAKLYRDNRLVFVDFEKALKNRNTPSNLFLENGDRIEIPKERQTVTIAGQVLNPTSVAYQPGFVFRDYIAQAGGFTDSAFVRKTYVIYANGSTDRTRSFLGIKAYPKVKSGMTVMVPKRNRVRMTTAERIALSTGLVSLSAVLLTLIRLI